MSVIFVPQCSSLFIDKLSLTLSIKDKDVKNATQDFIDFIGSNYGGKLWESQTYMYNMKIYYDGEYVLFQCCPKHKSLSWFRVEYNPSKVSPSEVAEILNHVLPGGYQGLIKYGRITRIDIAVDCKWLSVWNLLFYYPGLAVSFNYLKSGSIQTATIGGNECVNQFQFYNKVAEINAKNGKLGKLYKKATPSHPLTRIELRYRPNHYCTFDELLFKTVNPLENLRLSLITGMPKSPKNELETMTRQTFELAKFIGLPQALNMVPKHRKKYINDILNAGKTDWWKPKKLWETLPAAIEPIINPVLSKYAMGHK
ncbi:MAG: hypothetical protein HGA96_02645 [Desulfobulbaceae bacterium]|nr:hypothetical protein [Desulfobulbaceae bacterium]